MKMTKFNCPTLQESYYKTILSNGLTVILAPKKGFSKSYAVFATHYGSLDTDFKLNEQEDFISVPKGIAHFLEHKLFECADGTDAAHNLAKLGADANAYTTYDRTAYLFTTTDNVQAATLTLLDFVQEAAFNDKSVLAEQGIIEQELLMYLDNPNMAIVLGTLQLMYAKHNIKDDIVGTQESIKAITKKELDLCHQIFYVPSNMVLVVVGNIEATSLLEAIANNQSAKNFKLAPPIIRKTIHEDSLVVAKTGSREMDINIVKTAVGIKFGYENLGSIETLKKEILFDIITYLFFEKGSDNYHYLLQKEIINNSFDYELVIEDEYGHLIITCDTFKYQEFNETIISMLLAIREAKVAPNDFERARKMIEAAYLRKFNSLEFMANHLANLELCHLTIAEQLKVISELKLTDLQPYLAQFNEQAICTYTIFPKQQS